MGVFQKIRENAFIRNLILAVCTFVIIIFIIQVLLNLGTRHGESYEVPDFNGLTFREAVSLSKNAKLELEINDSLYLPARTPGIILEQTPSAGSSVKSGRRVFLTINAFSPRTAVIPYVAGYSLRQAKNNLEVAGFEIEKLVYRDDLATNNVLEQQYKGQRITSTSNIEAPMTSGVTLVVGRGQDHHTTRVPKVVGFPLKEAKSRLWEQGLNVGKVTMDNGITEVNLYEARVSKQSSVGSLQNLGTAVDIHLSVDEKTIEEGNAAADRAARTNASASVARTEE